MALKDLSPEDKQTILEHLEELRKSLIISVIAIVVAAVLSFSYNEEILAIVTSPLTDLYGTIIIQQLFDFTFSYFTSSNYETFPILQINVKWV
jgi:sec-independent protein translocase protein TatC